MTPPDAAPARDPAPRLQVLPGGGGLVATNLGKRYRKRPVVRNVSLAVQRGEAVGLLGPNGAGKTTCFYLIVGLVRPDYGRITLDGVDITTLPMYRRARLGLGYLPQEESVFRKLSVQDNLLAILETRPHGVGEHRDRAIPTAGQLSFHKVLDLDSFLLFEDVHFREQQTDIRCIALQVPDKFDVVLGQWRIDANRY